MINVFLDLSFVLDNRSKISINIICIKCLFIHLNYTLLLIANVKIGLSEIINPNVCHTSSSKSH